MKHTLESIAGLAGVSRGTVSRVINDQPGVKPEVREKVLGIIEQTGYYPHPQARSLAGGKTGNIGVMVFGLDPNFLTHHIFYEVLQGIQTDSAAYDYDLLLFANRSQSDREYWKRIGTRRKVDGLIIMGETIREEYLQYYRQQHIPYVLVGKRSYEGLPLACVTSNYRGGAYQATRHLLERGRSRIAYIGGLRDTYHETERFTGYKKAHAESGFLPDSSLVMDGRADQGEARKRMGQLLDSGVRPDAVFAANDLMAFGAMEALFERGLRVPEDVAVVGYDDIQAAPYFTPPLTTVRQDKIRLGREAMGLLMELLRGDRSPYEAKDIVIENELIIRKTT
ncbi:transcriptional regulator, LacI family [Paenibacillus sp. UNCCL117]|uniref:LacI family DNA-binding transcriptional regulator n=1 Tax=unclassified Paenibacillus TaxID=185978 RepID=UPI000881AEF4|nr:MULTISPECIES: LacI family DNA-binding transcriptional regulator [unclassified Paenibacillus]SDD16766.1 transcriptional regulator, LacI family [Paenibacillus sp. cl123]SFW34802.1 transcriptional regulator, LacI family [Paenibacillus sp. UNCCL117]